MKQPLIILCLFATLSTAAQHATPDTIRIRTNAICDQCKHTIEGELIYEKGVKHVQVDLASEQVVVAYDGHRTDPQRIRAAITHLGYQADELPADTSARRRLPACCRAEKSDHK